MIEHFFHFSRGYSEKANPQPQTHHHKTQKQAAKNKTGMKYNTFFVYLSIKLTVFQNKLKFKFIIKNNPSKSKYNDRTFFHFSGVIAPIPPYDKSNHCVSH